MSRDKILTFKFQKLNARRLTSKRCSEAQEQCDSAELCCGRLSPPTISKPDHGPGLLRLPGGSVRWAIFSIASDVGPEYWEGIRIRFASALPHGGGGLPQLQSRCY